jgi:hypothetical protein
VSKVAKQERKQEPDFLTDTISAVEAYDRARLSGSEDAEKLKSRAIRLIEQTNKIKGDGYISISKARAISQAVLQREKVEFLKHKSVNN